MEVIVSFINDKLPKFSYTYDDDFADRLAHRYTGFILFLFAIIVTGKQFVGDGPIQCWSPAHFSKDQEEYVNSLCWIQNTYRLPADDSEDIPREDEPEKRNMITYYQWIPLLLLGQALLFYLPRILWMEMNGRSGINIFDLIQASDRLLMTEVIEEKERMLKYMTMLIDRFLTSQRDETDVTCTISAKHILTRSCFRCCGRRRGNYLFTLYLYVKVLSLANILIQLTLLNYFFLGLVPRLYGIELIRAMIAGRESTEMERFPRLSMCDIKIRRLANLQRYTVECVLQVNLFNEKVYVFLWFWLVLVAGTQIFTLVRWIVHQAFIRFRRRYVKKHIRFSRPKDINDQNYRRKLNLFPDDYLQQDGVFLLRLLGHNTNALSITQLVCSLWDNFKQKEIRTKGGCSDGV